MEKEFYCAVCECEISQYDCDEITCAAQLNYLINDGLPQWIDIETIMQKRNNCVRCTHCDKLTKKNISEQINNKNTKIKMSEEEIKSRLSGRAAEYFMFLDD